jgi:hypothetical protein
MQLSLNPRPVRLACAAAALLIVVLLSSAFARSASAMPVPEGAAAPWDCQVGHLCLYKHANYGVKIFDIPETELGVLWVPPANQVSSWVNQTSKWFMAQEFRHRLFPLPGYYKDVGYMRPSGFSAFIGKQRNDRMDRLKRVPSPY